MFQVNQLNLSIQRVPILRDVSLEIETGSICGLIGRNGAGKTSLMRSIMAVVPIEAGESSFLN